jgi:hypothetical protein
VQVTLPREPDLYDEALHAKYEGVKLYAWIAAQQLAPVIMQRLKDNRLPRLFDKSGANIPHSPVTSEPWCSPATETSSPRGKPTRESLRRLSYDWTSIGGEVTQSAKGRWEAETDSN